MCGCTNGLRRFNEEKIIIFVATSIFLLVLWKVAHSFIFGRSAGSVQKKADISFTVKDDDSTGVIRLEVQEGNWKQLPLSPITQSAPESVFALLIPKHDAGLYCLPP